MNRRVGSVDVCDKKLLHRRSTSDFNRPWTSWQEINGTIIGADFLKVAHKKETHGFTAMIKKDFSEAVLHFSEAIGINPKKALIWLQRCKCLMSLGQFELAAKDAMMAISLSKNFFNPYYRLIDCYLNLDEIDKAEDVIVEILNVAPSINATITNRYESFERFKTLKNIIDLTKYCEPDKCLVALQETLRLAPASIDHQFLRLQILAALGNSDLQNEKFFHHDVPKMLAAYFAGNLVVSLKIMNKVSLKRESKSFERFKTMLIKIVAGIKSGEKEEKKKKYGKAIAIFEPLLSADVLNKQLNKQLHFRIGNLYLESKGNISLAIASAVAAYEIDRNFYEAIVLKSKCFYELGAFVKSIAECNKVLQSEASDEVKRIAQELKLKADIALRTENISSANELKVSQENFVKEFLEPLVRLSSSSVLDESTRLGDSAISRLFDENSFEECLKWIDKCGGTSGDKYKMCKIECLIMLDKFEQADQLLDQMDPLNSQMTYLQALKYYRQSYFKLCIEMLNESLEIGPKFNQIQKLKAYAMNILEHYEHGVAFYKSKQFSEARDAFHAALSVDNHVNKNMKTMLLCNLGLANMNLRDYKIAIDNFNEALRLNECHVKSLRKRAEAHYALQEYEDCLIDCEEALKFEASREVTKLINDANLASKRRKDVSSWEVLGVAFNASDTDFKTAYHKLSLLYHCDKHPCATAVEKKKLKRKFLEVKEAYQSFQRRSGLFRWNGI